MPIRDKVRPVILRVISGMRTEAFQRRAHAMTKQRDYHFQFAVC